MSPAIQNLFSGFVGAVIGAVLGAWLTYMGSRRLEQDKLREMSLRLYCVLLAELSKHHASLFRTIDGVLPAWLRRGEVHPTKGQDATLRSISIGHPTLETSYFKAFLEKLINADLFVPIANYYAAVDVVNSYAHSLNQSVQPEEHMSTVYAYIRQCVAVFQASPSMQWKP